MRRILFMLTASAALLALAPAAALARHHHQTRRVHHARHHARVHFERFGATSSGPSDRTAGTSHASEPSSDAGMVSSFNNGVLTIALRDGSTVSGTVTNGTELRCDAADSSSMRTDDERGDDHGGRGDDNGENEAEPGEDAESCTTANLTPGTMVREAELRVSGAGASWDKVELVTSPSSSPEDEGNDS